MSHWGCHTFTAAILLSLLAQTVSAAPVQKNKSATKATATDGWHLNQHTELFGDAEVLVSQAGLCAENLKTGVRVLISAPFKTVYLINTQSKKCYQSPLASFHCPLTKMFAIFASFRVDEVPMEATGEEKFCDMHVTRYLSTKDFSRKQYRMSVTDHIPKTNPQLIEYKNTDAPNIPALAGCALSKYYNLKPMPGLPLYARTQNLNKGNTITLQTSSATRVKIDPAKFAMPPGYAPVKSGEEIFQANMSEESMGLFER